MSLPIDIFPKTKTQAATLLYAAARELQNPGQCFIKDRSEAVVDRNYDDHKAGQLLEILGDIVLAEAKLEAWHADMLVPGCGACGV